MTNKQPADIAEMDALFRRVDFAADDPALAERLWTKIQSRLEKKEKFVMAIIERNRITKKMIEKAMKCKNADELVAAAKADGYELAVDEAEAYLAELSDFERLDDEALSKAAGGRCQDCYSECTPDNWRPL